MSVCEKANVTVVGPVDGMNEAHPKGSYFRLVITVKDEMREPLLMSRGAFEALRDELNWLLAVKPHHVTPSEPMISAMLVEIEKGRGSGSMAEMMRRVWIAGANAR